MRLPPGGPVCWVGLQAAGCSSRCDDVGVVGEQLVSMKCREPVVWCMADVDIGSEVSRDRRALRHAAVDCWRLRGREERVTQARVSRSETSFKLLLNYPNRRWLQSCRGRLRL
eukprot:scaffold25806_cov69-Phaeocystis_antarctica.AAC.1